MKKVLFLGMAAIFSLAVLVTSCSDDDDKTCVDCTDGTTEHEVCWKSGNDLDKLQELVEFAVDHPNAICDEE